MKNQVSLRRMLYFTGIIAVVLAVFAAIQSDDPFSGSDFDRIVWLQFANNYTSDNPRASMIEDLKLHYLLPGLSKSDVVELLGPPEAEPVRNTFSYIVGKWSGYRMDHDALLIKFDSGERLVSVECVQY
jgi:outer membrane protein assembly factor BamE (lipoprotein component of BamABCDE complex)